MCDRCKCVPWSFSDEEVRVVLGEVIEDSELRPGVSWGIHRPAPSNGMIFERPGLESPGETIGSIEGNDQPRDASVGGRQPLQGEITWIEAEADRVSELWVETEAPEGIG